jgi:hypothetical protein
LIEHVLEIAAAGSKRASLPRPPEVPQAVHGGYPQPGTEGARPAAVPEARQLAHQGGEHLLNQVVRVRGLQTLPAKPTPDQRRVEIHQPLPGGGVRLEAQTLQ